MASDRVQIAFKSLPIWVQIVSNWFQIAFKLLQCRFNVASMSLQRSFETFFGWGHARIIVKATRSVPFPRGGVKKHTVLCYTLGYASPHFQKKIILSFKFGIVGP